MVLTGALSEMEGRWRGGQGPRGEGPQGCLGFRELCERPELSDPRTHTSFFLQRGGEAKGPVSPLATASLGLLWAARPWGSTPAAPYLAFPPPPAPPHTLGRHSPSPVPFPAVAEA